MGIMLSADKISKFRIKTITNPGNRINFADRDPAARLAGWEQVSTLDDEEGNKKVQTKTTPTCCSYLVGEQKQNNRIKTTTDVTAASSSTTRTGCLNLLKIGKAQRSYKPSRSVSERVIENNSHRNKTVRERNEWVSLKRIADASSPPGAVVRLPNESSSNITENHESEQSLTTENTNLLRVPILGSHHSGKSTLVRQFVHCSSFGNLSNTLRQPEYYDRLITFNDRLYNLRLIDCPPIEGKYPTTSFEEWSAYRGWGLRSATAYILVFDVTSDYSFQYVRQLREQIVSEWSDVPLLLVANKIDSFHNPNFAHNHSVVSTGTTTAVAGLSGTDGLSRSNIRRELAVLVKKQWKGTVLVECSAKYNWHVVTVFKELMKLLESKDQSHKPNAARAVQNVLRRNQCTTM
ncbi:GTP-binding domain protein [Paragonimus heterotremus]|uniref:GTP-binding domain protein n=1 Tax=Paragonimus heterotremus TaxID=100268 RepID=A0A8J4WMA7_9TREM|nr:GTP-binding domain protein [Paragonimus heterotremus]